MTPEHLTISGPEDILGYIPHSLGYWPSQSLVAMTMQGKRLGATLRVDLPERGGRRSREAFARTVAEYLLADKEADGSLLVFFTDGGNNDGGREGAAALSFRPLLADLECALGLAGMPVRDAWRVGDEYWRNLYCTDSSCCPMPGRSVAEIRDSRLNAEMVYLGSSVGAPPGAPSPGNASTTAADDAAVMAAEREWSLALAGKGTQRAQFDAVLDAWAAALGAASPEAVSAGAILPEAAPPEAAPGKGLEPQLAGFLRASLHVPAWRDAVLVMAAAGRATAASGAEAFGIFSAATGLPVSCPPLPESRLSLSGLPSPAADGGVASSASGTDSVPGAEQAPGKGQAPGTDSVPGAEQAPGTGLSGDRPDQGMATGRPDQVPASSCGPDALPGYGEVLLGLSPAVPDWDTLRRLEGLMAGLSSCGGGEAQAAALTATGWIEWCRGRGSFAHASLTRALDASPGYRLAELLSEVVRRGTICGWAGRREAAWQKFGSDAA
ncbi:DUF4192 family protein [Arthrobacter globiformis]|uniref:DUF4192 family protein n=1 Tax=Arthrobacter globiformis TaxID=1665 RepID=UPI002789EB0F|nr:DUF4192 family protein [Arthrobacter globiformis]MDQ0864384.1 hypothetical protein [Arthrobacter globiformis]